LKAEHVGRKLDELLTDQRQALGPRPRLVPDIQRGDALGFQSILSVNLGPMHK
jgi:hypothetical protein